MPESEKGSTNSAKRQEDLGIKRNKKTRIREGRRRKGGVNDEPKTPRPNARPQPQKPSSSDSSSSSQSSNSDSDE